MTAIAAAPAPFVARERGGGLERRIRSPLVPGAIIVIGALLRVAGESGAGDWLWMIGLWVSGAPLVARTVYAATRGSFATDLVATMAIVGAVLLNEPLAGLVIVLMQTGGEALDRYAEGRASQAVRSLEAAAPRVAHRVADGRVDDIAASDVRAGDELIVRPGDLVPCDGTVIDGESELDTSSLTGEASPLRVVVGLKIASGYANGYGAFRMRATAPASGSQYARIVELVRTAQASKAPLQRLADRYAVWFTPLTIATCALALWVTHDWNRVLAILVVATPCPLILAAPVAFMGGINRAARHHVILRSGEALERLARADTMVFDKTGTITLGAPRLSMVRPANGFTRKDVLQLAAAVEQGSSHRLARVLVNVAEAEHLEVGRADRMTETPGHGITGQLAGRTIAVGGRRFVLARCGASAVPYDDSTLRAYVAVDGQFAGIIDFADAPRPEALRALSALRAAGFDRLALVSGDDAGAVSAMAQTVGISEAHGDMLPADKAAFVGRLVAEGRRVMMVGDGVNDAPALAVATVGVALAGHGGGVTAEAADVIVLADSLDDLIIAHRVSRRTMRIARQSIGVGIGLSAVAMVAAAAGAIAPVEGALLQEAIDVAVILNALRTAGPIDTHRRDS
jgi:heavy metal translocating P-type ATPase